MPSRITVSRARIDLVEVGPGISEHRPLNQPAPATTRSFNPTRRCAQAFAHSPHGLAVELLCRDAVVSWKLPQTSCLGNNKDTAVPAGQSAALAQASGSDAVLSGG